MNVLFLDMDGVLNNNALTRQWRCNKEQELKKLYPDLNDYEIFMKSGEEFMKLICNGKEYIFPELANRLKEIIEKCNIKIIWSSTWRLLDEYRDINHARDMFNRRGLIGDALIGYTPNMNHLSDYPHTARVREILYFMNHNDLNITFNDKIAVIDDLNLSSLERSNIKFFATEMEFGLTEKIKNEMIKYYES